MGFPDSESRAKHERTRGEVARKTNRYNRMSSIEPRQSEVHEEEKACAGGRTFVLIILVIMVFPSFSQVTASTANTTVNLYVGGSSVILDSPPLDLCHALNRSACPIKLRILESFSEEIAMSLAADRTVLQPGDSVTVSAYPNPSNPSASLDFIFAFGDRSFDYVYPLFSMPALGPSYTSEITIPGSTLFSTLNLPPLAVNLTVTSQVTAALVGDFGGAGFSSGQSLEWPSIGPKTITSTLSGANETSELSLSLTSSQDWQNSLYLTSPIIGRIPVYGVPHSEVAFRSDEAKLLAWHHLSAESQYSNSLGSGWYFSGTSTMISVSDNATNVNPGERKVFAGWQGTGSGSYTGPERQHSVAVNNPIGEVAQWKTQYLVSLNQSNGGMVIPSQATGWYDEGYPLVLNAKPSPPQQFQGWVVNDHLVSRSPTFTYNVNSTSRISAEFSAGSPSTTASFSTNKTEQKSAMDVIVQGVGNYLLISALVALLITAIAVVLIRARR